MNIKNYTSQVAAETSISKIEKLLVKAGADNILKKYDKGMLKGISFTMIINGNSVAFKLEAKVATIYSALMDEYTRPTDKSHQIAKEQAERTAWKIISDWVEIQLTLIKLEQAEFIQVFLPYVYDPATDSTFYNRLKDENFKLLKGGAK